MNIYHTSVLLQEVVEYLGVQAGGKYIDATIGGGGHSFEILRKGGRVLGIDVDQEALVSVEEELRIKNKKLRENLILVRGNFRDIDTIAKDNGFENVAGILFDFGVSSHQIDDPARGFSFQKTGPLDMRMDQQLTVTAKDLINGLHRKELMTIFQTFGEERFAHGIATEIVKSRKSEEITTTDQLQEIIFRAMPAKLDRTAAAARIFQALRIVVNDELQSISIALPKALELIKSKGRIVAISFHSLEDRIVKQQFQQFEEKEWGTIRTEHPVTATKEEIAQNSRSRSAKLRVFEKK